jgi:hypothetical protein
MYPSGNGMLLSTRTLERYAVHAMDGDMGRVCDVHSHEPVSRQHEAAILRYFGFPYYWTGPAMNPAKNWEGRGDPHLRSARAVRYAVREVDGTLGRVPEPRGRAAPPRILRAGSGRRTHGSRG